MAMRVIESMASEARENPNGRPIVTPHALKVLTRDWGEEIFFADCPKYLGKILKMKAGTKGGLQYHEHKDETFYVLDGTVLVRSEDEQGNLTEQRVSGGEAIAFHIIPGSVHQVEAVTDATLVEASTAHYDDRVRCEWMFGLPEGGGLPTTR